MTRSGETEACPVPSDLDGPPPIWVELVYEPVAPFSLRGSLSTSAGGKTLLVPTPYAIKLALIDAEISGAGLDAGRTLFDAVKAAAVAILPSPRACVTNTFVKSMKLWQFKGKKSDDDDEEASAGGEMSRPFEKTLRYRELCILQGPLTIWLGLRSQEPVERVRSAGRRVNYFGKRGGFFQARHAEVVRGIDPRASVVDPAGWSPATVPAGDVSCLLDDLGPRATLERVSPFSSESAAWDADRVVHPRLLAMRQTASGSHFTIYERLPADFSLAGAGRP